MKYNLRKIKGKSSYSIREVSELLEVGRKTVQRWIKEGLDLLDSHQKPILIMGYDLKNFIESKRKAKRIKLKFDEFYCLACKKPTYSNSGEIRLEDSGKKIGKNERCQKIRYGKCQECGGNICRLF